jgi:HEAT repeat protein
VIEPKRAEVVAATLGLLDDGSGEVRKEAALTVDTLGLQIPEVAPALERALAREAARPDGREEVRRVLSTALAARRLPGRHGAALRQLLGDLAHPDWIVRSGAAHSLGRLGAREAVPLLAKALEDENALVRGSAAEALGAIGSPDAVPALTEALADAEAGVLERAAVALRDLGARSTARDRAVPRLVQALDDGTYLDRTAALRALAELGTDALGAVPALVRALGGTKAPREETYVRVGAATALGKLGPRARAAVPSLAAALGDPQPEVRRASAEALAALDDRSDSVIRGLIASTRDTDESVRLASLNALRRLGAPEAQQALEQAVPGLARRLADTDPEGRRDAAWRLAGLGESARPAADALVRCLDDPDEWVRSFAAQALANLGPAARLAVGRLEKLLRSERTRLPATVALGRIGPEAEAAVPALLMVIEDPDDAARHAAAEALFRIGTPPARAAYRRHAEREVPRLLETLRSGDRDPRGEAARHLSRFTATAVEAIGPLATALDDEYWLVRCKATEALGGFGPGAKAAVPRLAVALDDPHVYVREAAREALKKIATPEARAALDR